MKILKISSLVVLGLVYTFLVFRVSWQAGENTEHNRLLWRTLTVTEPLPTFVTLPEQRGMYQYEKRTFAMPTAGDWE